MKKFAIVFGSFWLLGLLLGMHVASLRNYEFKSKEEVLSYVNQHVQPRYTREGNLRYIQVPFCSREYEYDMEKDTVVSKPNTKYSKSNKLGFGEISATGIMEGLGILGVVSIPALRENVYSMVSNDWRYMVIGVAGGGLGFGLGYYLKHRTPCDFEQPALEEYLSDKNNLKVYTEGYPQKGVLVPLSGLRYKRK